MLLLKNSNENLTKINSLVAYKQKSFGDALLEYFDCFWKAHSLPENWLNEDSSHYMTESKPMFQGAVIYNNEPTYYGLRKTIEKLFSDSNWGWRLTGAYVTGNATARIFNRAGVFEFFDITKAEDGNLVNYMCGKSYDVVIFLDVEINEETILSLMPILKEGNPNRVFNLKY